MIMKNSSSLYKNVSDVDNIYKHAHKSAYIIGGLMYNMSPKSYHHEQWIRENYLPEDYLEKSSFWKKLTEEDIVALYTNEDFVDILVTHAKRNLIHDEVDV